MPSNTTRTIEQRIKEHCAQVEAPAELRESVMDSIERLNRFKARKELVFSSSLCVLLLLAITFATYSAVVFQRGRLSRIIDSSPEESRAILADSSFLGHSEK